MVHWAFSVLLFPTSPTPASSFSFGAHSPFFTYIECDGVANELGVLLHHLLHTALLQILSLVLLQVQDHFGATANGLTCSMGRETLVFQGREQE